MRALVFICFLGGALIGSAQNARLDIHLNDDQKLIEVLRGDIDRLYCLEDTKEGEGHIVLATCACNLLECGMATRFLILSNKSRIPFMRSEDVVRCSTALVSGGGYLLELNPDHSIKKITALQ